MLVATNAFWQKVFEQGLFHQEDGVDGWLDLLKLLLFTNDITPTKTTLYADLVKPTYTGYADLTGLVAGAVFQRTDKGWAVQFGAKQFQMGDAALPTTLMGYGIYSTSGTVLYWAERFPNPVPLVTTADACIFDPQFCLGGDDNGEVTMLN